jgi:hypothetical protein
MAGLMKGRHQVVRMDTVQIDRLLKIALDKVGRVGLSAGFRVSHGEPFILKSRVGGTLTSGS